jgi:taurine dioxygenase
MADRKNRHHPCPNARAILFEETAGKRSMELETNLLSPFGVEIAGLSLKDGTADAEYLRTQVERHGVAVVRDQFIDDTTFVALLKELGPMTFTQGETPVDHAPMLNVVSNVGRTTTPRSVFHSDTSYAPAPPSFTALRPVTLPREGGATLFSDQCGAYDRLPPVEAEALRHVRVKHRVTGLEGRDESVWHPLLRRHPGTGRIALFLSTPERCVAMEGAEPGAPDIATLYDRATAPDVVYRHDWRPGDILIWDNRCTMHRADHADVAGDRVLHRGMVTGEVPIPAFP